MKYNIELKLTEYYDKEHKDIFYFLIPIPSTLTKSDSIELYNRMSNVLMDQYGEHYKLIDKP